MKKTATTFFATGMVLALFLSSAFAAQSFRLSDSPSGAMVLDQTTEGLTVKLEIGELLFTPVSTKGGPFTVLSVTGFARSYELGSPALPILNKNITIPFGCELKADVLDYEVEELLLSDLDIKDPIIPAQPSLSKSDDPALIPFSYNQEAYQRPGYYTLPGATIRDNGIMRAVRLGMLTLSPIEYSPTEGKIRIMKSMTVRVQFVNADWAETQAMYERYHSPVFQPVYDKLMNYAAAEPQYKGGKSDLTKYPIKYLIVSHRMFEAQLQPFIAWKKQKGFNVIVGYTDVIGTTNTAIKAWIKSQYDAANPPADPAPSFVLLVGDAQEIPPFSTSGSQITDLRFCEFTSDNHPEIYYGRFSAHTTAELQPQIDKTLEYEKYLMPDPSYLGEVTMIAGVDASHAPTWGNGQINYGTTQYFNATHGIYSNTWLYPASDGSGASAAIIQTVNDGIGYINYTAHGGHDSWSDPSFTVSDIASLTNIHKYNLAIGNCCLTGTFGTDYSTPCFGEVWLQKANKGGIGYIGGTESTYWDEDYWWGVGNKAIVAAGPPYDANNLGSYDGLFHTHGEAVSDHYITNDAMIFCGNLAVEEGNPSSAQYYWEIYTLFGDPSVMTYLGVPAVNGVSHAATIMMTAPTITVDADPSSYVGITVNGVLHGAGYVDQTGSVEITLTPFAQPCVADIVVSCQNRQPYISTVQVITPEGPYVIYDSSAVDDASGNDDGLVDIGESIVLGVQVQNVGPDDALDVTATLSSTDAYVTITDATESYGTVAGDNGTAYSATAFAFDAASNTPDGHVVKFDLTVTGTAKETWVSSFNIPVHSPAVEYVSMSIDDSQGGNGNGKLDPGETVELVVTLHNAGSSSALALSGSLSESDAFLSISDNLGYWGDIAPDASADNSADAFTIEADSSCPMGYAASTQLNLSAGGGYSATINLQMIVGDRVVFHYDDLAVDLGWTGLGGTAEWAIGSPAGGGGDPSQDHSPTTDNKVLGNDLTSSGTYSNSISGTQWATSPIIDCSDYSSIQLRFHRWLGVESSSYDHAYLEVYNGTSWVQLYSSGATMQETAWNEQFHDLSQYADNNPDFRIRFGLGPTDGSEVYSGWNIDDIELKGYYQGSGGTPAMALEPTSYVDSVAAGQPIQHILKVKNTGDGTLRVRFSPGQTWISCNGDNNYVPPADSMNFPFTETTAGMTPGLHTGSLLYTTNIPGGATGSMPVNVYIHPPVVQLVTGTYADSLVEGQSENHSLVVKNTGLGALTITFTPGASWLSCATSANQIASGDSLVFPFAINAANVAPGEHTGNLNYTSNDPSNPSGAVPASLYVYPPDIDVAQTSISGNLETGEADTIPLSIGNVGVGRLYFDAGAQTFDKLLTASAGIGGKSVFVNNQVSLAQEERVPIEYRVTDPDKTGLEEPFYADVEKGSGGPDAFGHEWIDSDEPGGPTFFWVDISAVGTPVTLTDDGFSAAIPMGINFPYFENTYSNVYICANGMLSFTQGYSQTTNTNFPNASVPNNIIAMWWDDLDPPEAGNVYCYADAVNNRFIVSFVGIRNYMYPTGTGSLTFQAILYPSGRVVLQYGAMDPGSDADGLHGASIGVENSNGTDGLAVVYNANYMHSNLAITISSSHWLSVSPASGVIEPGGVGSIGIILNAADMEDGTYQGQISIASNDPLTPTVNIPVTLNIGAQANQPPALVEIGPRSVTEGETLAFNVTASDPNGTTPALFAENRPENSSFVDNGNGTGAFSFTPNNTQAGTYNVTFIAFDGELADTEIVAIEVTETYMYGDANGSGYLDIDDVVYLIQFIFADGPEPVPYEAGDADCSGFIDIDDAVYLIQHIFAGGPAPDCSGMPAATIPSIGKQMPVGKDAAKVD